MKKVLCLLMVCTITFLAACGSTSSPEPQETQAVFSDPELILADSMGLLGVADAKELNQPVTYQQFTDLLDRMIQLVLPEAISQWEARSASFRDAATPMTRIEGAVVLLYAAECIEADTLGFNESANLPDLVPEGFDFWDGITYDYPLLEGWQDIYHAEELDGSNWYWRCEQDYLQNGLWFAQHRSYASGKTYLDYDKNFMMDFGSPFTSEAAAKAVLRLYETSQYIHYVPIKEISCTLTPETLALGQAFPEASEQKLPNWHGHTIGMPSWYTAHYAGQNYQEEEVRVLAEQGFNFTRVPLDARLFFEGEDFSRVNLQRMKDLDQLITWCAQYGIHVCLDLHDMPGFYTGGDNSAVTLFDSPETQALFTAFWKFMAHYYRDVPKNLLSFNLLNEPHASGELTDTVYTSVMIPAIEAIREENPERIIFADMIGWLEGVPSQGLVETGVVQSWHPYLFTGDTAAVWPAYYINGFIHKSNGALTLTGDFPAGTTLTLPISMFHSQGNLVLKADGTDVSSLALGSETLGSNGCIEIGEEGTGGEFRSYENKVWEIVLPQDAATLVIEQTDNAWWYMIGAAITVQTPANTYTLLSGSHLVPSEKVPQLTLLEDGTISAQHPETLAAVDLDYLLKKFEALAQFRAETGIQIMAQEFGFSHQIPQSVAVPATKDTLEAFAQWEIPWCVWCTDFGPLIDQREVTRELTYWNTGYRRDGSTYVPVSENWLANEEMMQAFQRYMQ